MIHPDSHALLALLWASNLETEQASPQLLAQIHTEWSAFRATLEAAGFDPEQALLTPLPADCYGDPWAYVAHDWMMTRNHHGCGFWDGDWSPEWSDFLVTESHKFTELTPYLEENLIYV